MEDQSRISIRNLERIEKTTRSSDKLLAKFDVGIGGINLLGCALVEAGDGYQAVLLPGRVRGDGRRPVFIADAGLRLRLLRLVQLKLARSVEPAGATPTWRDGDKWSKPGATWTNTSGNAAENESLALAGL